MFISSDTNVWIDFARLKHLDYPFLLDFEYYISSDTFRDELITPDNLRCELDQRGLHLTDVTDAEFMEALRFTSVYKELSQYDAFALAIAKFRHWILLTGDMPLRKAAQKEHVECHGTIWFYDQLRISQKLSSDEYRAAITDLIKAVNSGICRLPLSELEKRLMEQT